MYLRLTRTIGFLPLIGQSYRLNEHASRYRSMTHICHDEESAFSANFTFANVSSEDFGAYRVVIGGGTDMWEFEIVKDDPPEEWRESGEW